MDLERQLSSEKPLCFCKGPASVSRFSFQLQLSKTPVPVDLKPSADLRKRRNAYGIVTHIQAHE